MRTMKTILAAVIVVAVAGIVSFGCGSDVASGISLADAREECNLFELIAEGRPLSDGLFNAVVIQAESFRDEGVTQRAYINGFIALCADDPDSDAERDQCFACWTSIAAVVWP